MRILPEQSLEEIDFKSIIPRTLRYEDGKARTGTAVDTGNFRGSRCVAKNKMLKRCIFAKDGDFKINVLDVLLNSNIYANI